MMYNTAVDYTRAENEQHVGLFGTDMSPHLNMPQNLNQQQHLRRD
ncbi:hypothetical protein PF010_g7152 [Phytophthora fragariae]|uniref:Uncharacterized protein n=1 Tax=Phytophthora fragariae TaxID=53985 RepID=A0A6G0P9K9_9STRA|nr:hypothetical protein PF010_g7152 [Phytophthora fragariae]KAE9240571.1 hypothetical protein PF004_g7438 [Phytophthora fragariae]